MRKPKKCDCHVIIEKLIHMTKIWLQKVKKKKKQSKALKRESFLENVEHSSIQKVQQSQKILNIVALSVAKTQRSVPWH